MQIRTRSTGVYPTSRSLERRSARLGNYRSVARRAAQRANKMYTPRRSGFLQSTMRVVFTRRGVSIYWRARYSRFVDRIRHFTRKVRGYVSRRVSQYLAGRG